MLTTANWMVATNRLTRSTELLGFLQQHESYQSYQWGYSSQILQLEETLQLNLTQAEYQAAIEIGQALSFEQVIIDLTAELED